LDEGDGAGDAGGEGMLESFSMNMRAVWELEWRRGLAWLRKIGPGFDWTAIIEKVETYF
jgi:hypothetical protein